MRLTAGREILPIAGELSTWDPHLQPVRATSMHACDPLRSSTAARDRHFRLPALLSSKRVRPIRAEAAAVAGARQQEGTEMQRLLDKLRQASDHLPVRTVTDRQRRGFAGAFSQNKEGQHCREPSGS